MNLERLKCEMEAKSISKSQLIKLSGVSETTIRRIWHGKTDVHISTLRMIADALDVDPMVLMDTASPVPEAFDPANVPEIAAAVLETITIVEENAPNDTPVILDASPNGGPPSYDTPAILTAPQNDAPAEDLLTAYREHIKTLRRTVQILAGVSGVLLAAVLILAIGG